MSKKHEEEEEGKNTTLEEEEENEGEDEGEDEGEGTNQTLKEKEEEGEEGTNISMVLSYYNRRSQKRYERHRLDDISPVEFFVTKFHLQKFLPPPYYPIPFAPKKLTYPKLKVCDVGVGFGHYSEHLAKEYNAKIYLVDISYYFIHQTRIRLERRGLRNNLGIYRKTSATTLSKEYANNMFDVVLLLGPLYHLLKREERRTAIRECMKVLKPNGLLFAAGLNRVSILRMLIPFARKNEFFLVNKDFEKFLRDGRIEEDLDLPLGIAYAHTFKQFREEFRDIRIPIDGYFDDVAKKVTDSKEEFYTLEEEKCIGTEGFTQQQQRFWRFLSPANQRAFMKLLALSENLEESYARSDHFLYIGRKRAVRSKYISVNFQEVEDGKGISLTLNPL